MYVMSQPRSVGQKSNLEDADQTRNPASTYTKIIKKHAASWFGGDRLGQCEVTPMADGGYSAIITWDDEDRGTKILHSVWKFLQSIYTDETLSELNSATVYVKKHGSVLAELGMKREIAENIAWDSVPLGNWQWEHYRETFKKHTNFRLLDTAIKW
jgi:hypothetical protein